MARIYGGGFEISHCRQGLTEGIFGKDTSLPLVLSNYFYMGSFVQCAERNVKNREFQLRWLMTILAIQCLRESSARTSSAPASICRLALPYSIFQHAQTVPACWAAQSKTARVIG